MWRLQRQFTNECPDGFADELFGSSSHSLILSISLIYLAWHFVTSATWPDNIGRLTWAPTLIFLLAAFLAYTLVHHHFRLAQSSSMMTGDSRRARCSRRQICADWSSPGIDRSLTLRIRPASPPFCTPVAVSTKSLTISSNWADGCHSYEDNILPVEEAYARYHDRIAILGGIDIDFLCRREPEEVYQRAHAMLERTADRGGYALARATAFPHTYRLSTISP